MSRTLLAVVVVAVSCFDGQAQTVESRPLPDPSQLKQRTLANMAKSQEALEKYSCTVYGSYDEFDKNGDTKKRSRRVLERFYVNGLQVDHVLERDGKVLTGSEAEKEQKKTDDQVRKLSDEKEAAKRRDKREQQTEMFLRAQKLTNARRESRWGYDTAGHEWANLDRRGKRRARGTANPDRPGCQNRRRAGGFTPQGL
jgi:hypothetical protein